MMTHFIFTVLTATCIMLVLKSYLMNSAFRTVRHEIAHAKQAYELGCKKVLIVLPGTMVRKDLRDEKFTYYVLPKKVYRKLFGKSNGVCCYGGDDLSIEDRLKIVEAGPKEDKNLNHKLEYNIIIFLFTLLLTMANGNMFSEIFDVANSGTAALLATATLSVVEYAILPVIMYVIIRYIDTAIDSKTGATKREMSKWKKVVKDAPENVPFSINISDGAKLRFREDYKECLEILKNKNANAPSVEERIKQLESLGYKPV